MAAAWISASLLLCLLLFVFAYSEGQNNIKAVIGENLILPCRAENRPILLLLWRRTDIKEGNIFLFRNGVVDLEYQHPSFKDRVVFQDIEKNDGDVSLVLINVRMNDAGTYEARVVYNRTNSEKKLICTVHLDVAPPPGSFPSWAKALLFLLGLILIGILLYSNRRLCPKPERPRRLVERCLSRGV